LKRKQEGGGLYSQARAECTLIKIIDKAKTIQVGKNHASFEGLTAHFGLGKHWKVETPGVCRANSLRTQVKGLVADKQVTVTQN